MSIEDRLRGKLEQRKEIGTLRTLVPGLDDHNDDKTAIKINDVNIKSSQRLGRKPQKRIDFSSNDYLGISRCPDQLRLVNEEFLKLIQATDTSFLPISTYPDVSSEDNKISSDLLRTEERARQEGRVSPLIAKHRPPPPLLGATGSRLLSGNSHYCMNLEHRLANFHNRPCALLCNSGYDANLSVLSSIPQAGDILILDELCHNSIFMGLRMGRVKMKEHVWTFRHNDVHHLKEMLRRALNQIDLHARRNNMEESGPSRLQHVFVVVESVYSMDGDVAPLADICHVVHQHRANLIVDEAHGLGVYGPTNMSDLSLVSATSTPANGEIHDMEENTSARKSPLSKPKQEGNTRGGMGVLAALNLERHPALLCSIYTFGKAAGCHGAVIVSSKIVVEYLINYARPFVYSTALPPHSLTTIHCAYETMMGSIGERRRTHTFRLVRLFRDLCYRKDAGDSKGSESFLLPSPSPIQSVLVSGNERCIRIAQELQWASFDVHPIRSPTVPRGMERIRIILHAHNTTEDVRLLVNTLMDLLQEDETGGEGSIVNNDANIHTSKLGKSEDNHRKNTHLIISRL